MPVGFVEWTACILMVMMPIALMVGSMTRNETANLACIVVTLVSGRFALEAVFQRTLHSESFGTGLIIVALVYLCCLALLVGMRHVIRHDAARQERFGLSRV